MMLGSCLILESMRLLLTTTPFIMFFHSLGNGSCFYATTASICLFFFPRNNLDLVLLSMVLINSNIVPTKKNETALGNKSTKTTKKTICMSRMIYNNGY